MPRADGALHALIDSLVEEIYRVSCEFADRKAARSRNSGLGIVATGGYGRKELSPFSDVDIAFIPSEEQDPWVEAAVHAAFKLVMDVFLSLREVHVGYSYRPISEVSTWDLPVRVSLLDARHLCGDRSLSARLQEQLRRNLSPLDLMLEIQQVEERQKREGAAAIYAVEPNLKEGRGSLRDLHRARWIYKLLLGVDDDELFPELERRGLMSSVRISEIEEAAEWFWRARNWLHLTAGKRFDVLINNYQDRIARDLGPAPPRNGCRSILPGRKRWRFSGTPPCGTAWRARSIWAACGWRTASLVPAAPERAARIRPAP